MKSINPIGRKEKIVIQELDGETLIYDLQVNKAFCLNETSALIWKACDGNNSVAEIRQLISKELKSPINDDFVQLALYQLKKDDLLANGEEINVDFNGLSRREVIKKVGLTSMVAFPIISSLTAPTAAHAQSACGPSQGANCVCPVTTGVGNTCTINPVGNPACPGGGCVCRANTCGSVPFGSCLGTCV